MKRTAGGSHLRQEQIRRDLTALRTKKRAIKHEMRTLEAEYKQITIDNDLSIEVPFRLFRELALTDSTMWSSTSYENPYAHRNDCQTAHCWYLGNMDRLDEMEICSLNDFPDARICDVCLDNGWQREVIEESEDPDETIELHPRFYCGDILHLLLENGIIGACENCGSHLVGACEGKTWFRACLGCNGDKPGHRGSSGVPLELCSKAVEIYLCNKCIYSDVRCI